MQLPWIGIIRRFLPAASAANVMAWRAQALDSDFPSSYLMLSIGPLAHQIISSSNISATCAYFSINTPPSSLGLTDCSPLTYPSLAILPAVRASSHPFGQSFSSLIVHALLGIALTSSYIRNTVTTEPECEKGDNCKSVCGRRVDERGGGLSLSDQCR